VGVGWWGRWRGEFWGGGYRGVSECWEGWRVVEMALEHRMMKMLWVAAMCAGAHTLLVGLRAVGTEGRLIVEMEYYYTLAVDMRARPDHHYHYYHNIPHARREGIASKWRELFQNIFTTTIFYLFSYQHVFLRLGRCS